MKTKWHVLAMIGFLLVALAFVSRAYWVGELVNDVSDGWTALAMLAMFFAGMCRPSPPCPREHNDWED